MKATINIKEFATELASSDSVDQALFFNTFSRELKIICRDEQLTGSQPYSIEKELDRNAHDFIDSIIEFRKLRNSTKP